MNTYIKVPNENTYYNDGFEICELSLRDDISKMKDYDSELQILDYRGEDITVRELLALLRRSQTTKPKRTKK